MMFGKGRPGIGFHSDFRERTDQAFDKLATQLDQLDEDNGIVVSDIQKDEVEGSIEYWRDRAKKAETALHPAKNSIFDKMQEESIRPLEQRVIDAARTEVRVNAGVSEDLKNAVNAYVDHCIKQARKGK